MVFFTACLSIHEQRIDSNRHFCSCNTVQRRSEISSSRSCCFRCCCSGERPSSTEDTSSRLEKLTRKFLTFFVFIYLVKRIVLFLFVVYIGCSIWKAVDFEVSSFDAKHVTKQSYFSKYEILNSNNFQSNFYISFLVPGFVLYSDVATVNDAFRLEERLKGNKYIDSMSIVSWFDEYNKTHNIGNLNTTLAESVDKFLSSCPKYRNDFVKDANGFVLNSRIYAKTRNIKSPLDVHYMKQALLNVKRFSDATDDFKESVSVSKNLNSITYSEEKGDISTTKTICTFYAPVFKYTDKYLAALKETLVHISTLFGTNVILNTLVCPHPMIFVLSTSSFAAVIIGLFGIMALLHVELTPFSLIIIVLASGYAVDIVTHSIYSFYHRIGTDRLSRAYEMLSSTSVMLLNTCLGSFIGMLVLFVEHSYVFLTVMKITMIATAIGCIHAAFVLPIALAMFGPNDEHFSNNTSNIREVKKIMIPNLSVRNSENIYSDSDIKLKVNSNNSAVFLNDAFDINEKF